MRVIPTVKSTTTGSLSQPAYDAAMMNNPGPTDAIEVPSFLTLVVVIQPLVIMTSASQDVKILQNHMQR